MPPQGPSAHPEEVPLARRAVRGGLWVALSAYWTIVFGFGAGILLTRLLSPEAFGAFALGMFFAQLLRLETKVGVRQAFGQHQALSPEALGTFWMLDLALILGGLLLTFLAAPILVSLGYPVEVVQVALALALAAALESLGSIAGTMLDRELRFGPISLWQAVVFPLSYGPAFWLALHGGGVWSLVAQNLVYSALLALGAWAIARWQLPELWGRPWRFDQALARRFLQFGLTVGAAALAAMLLSQLDNFMIGTLVGVTALGFYDRAYRIAQWPSTLLNTMLTRPAFYTYARVQDDVERLRRAAGAVLWGIMVLAWPIALFTFLAAPDLIRWLYGERWLPATPLLRALALVSAVRPVWDNAAVLFTAIGRPAHGLFLMGVQVLVLGAAGLPMTALWGPIGTCGAVGLAFLVGLVGAYGILRREIGLGFDRAWGVPLLAALFTLAGGLAGSRAAFVKSLPPLIRVGLLGLWVAGAYGGVHAVLLLRPLPRSAGALWRWLRSPGG